MIVSIGTKIKDGPWGGGNLFAINLRNYLEKKGHRVINNLDDNDIDVILITEPRKTSESSKQTHQGPPCSIFVPLMVDSLSRHQTEFN